jgi:hypothetical protein
MSNHPCIREAHDGGIHTRCERGPEHPEGQGRDAGAEEFRRQETETTHDGIRFHGTGRERLARRKVITDVTENEGKTQD